MRILLALLVVAVAGLGIWAVLAVGCDVAPDFVLFRGACRRGTGETAWQVTLGVAVVVGVAAVLDRRRRGR